MADKMTKAEMNAYYKDKGYYHKSDPRHPMNKESTGPSVMIMLGVKPPKKKPAEPKKKKMAKGGYANCGASMPATQKASKMAVGGMAKKSVPAGNPGLAKLPTQVRNKMGYMSYGGMARKKK
jgi:hypothetical protein